MRRIVEGALQGAPAQPDHGQPAGRIIDLPAQVGGGLGTDDVQRDRRTAWAGEITTALGGRLDVAGIEGVSDSEFARVGGLAFVDVAGDQPRLAQRAQQLHRHSAMPPSERNPPPSLAMLAWFSQ